MMETKRIKCPHCSVVLDVSNSKGEDIKHFLCPKCSASLAVSFVSCETVLHCAPTSLSMPALLYHGKTYRLAMGENIIGRKSPNSMANAQLETGEGKTMSRSHAIVHVVALSDGGHKSILSECEHVLNGTLVNGERLKSGDRIILHDGDTIKMGLETITFLD